MRKDWKEGSWHENFPSQPLASLSCLPLLRPNLLAASPPPFPHSSHPIIRKSFGFCVQNRSVIRLPHGIQSPSSLYWIIATASTLPPFACPAPLHSHRGSPIMEASSHPSLVLTKHSVALCLPKSSLTSSPFLSCSNPQSPCSHSSPGLLLLSHLRVFAWLLPILR